MGAIATRTGERLGGCRCCRFLVGHSTAVRPTPPVDSGPNDAQIDHPLPVGYANRSNPGPNVRQMIHPAPVVHANRSNSGPIVVQMIYLAPVGYANRSNTGPNLAQMSHPPPVGFASGADSGPNVDRMIHLAPVRHANRADPASSGDLPPDDTELESLVGPRRIAPTAAATSRGRVARVPDRVWS